MISEIDFGREADELNTYLGARWAETRRATLRAALVEQRGTTVRLATRVHFLPTAVEAELLAQRASLDDSIAVLRHCDPQVDPNATGMLQHARRMHDRVNAQIAQFVCELEVVADGELGQLLLAEVERFVDSELVQLCDGSDRDCRVVDGDIDSVERVRAFVHNVQQLGRRVQQAERERMLDELRRAQPSPRAVLADAELRRLRAIRELDMARAVRQAVDEVERAAVASADDTSVVIPLLPAVAHRGDRRGARSGRRARSLRRGRE